VIDSPRTSAIEAGDEVIVVNKRNQSKVDGLAKVKEVNGSMAVVTMGGDDGDTHIEVRRLRRSSVPKSSPGSALEPEARAPAADVPAEPKIGDPDSESYRDMVRKIVGRGSRAMGGTKGRTLDPRQVMLEIRNAGGPHVDKLRMESLLESMSGELQITPVDADIRGIHLKMFLFGNSTLEESLEGGYDIPGDIEILSPTSFKVLTRLELDMRRTAALRREEERAEAEERASFEAFCKSVLEIAGSIDPVTTTAIFDRLPKSDGEKDDSDGKLRKRIAEALKEIGLVPRVVTVDGRKVKVFEQRFQVRMAALKAAAEAQMVTEEKARMEKDKLDNEERLAEDTDAKFIVDPEGVTRFAGEPTIMEVGLEPEPAPEPVGSSEPEPEPEPGVRENLALLPADWKEMLARFLQGPGSGMTYISLEGIIFEAFGRIPQEIRVMDRGRLSAYLMSLGLVNAKFNNHGDKNSERKMFHVEGIPPSDEEMKEHFSKLDAAIMERLDIKVTDAPDWMSEDQRRDLAYLEHAVLQLCEDRPHNRIGLFPGHPSPNWQRSVVSSLISYDLVSQSGSGWSVTYSGVRPAILEALDRDFLLEAFWPKEFERFRGPPSATARAPEPESAPSHEPEREQGLEEEIPADRPPPTLEALEATVMDLFELLKDHSKTIMNLKRRVKELEERERGGR